jgi:isoamyl acetate esterase
MPASMEGSEVGAGGHHCPVPVKGLVSAKWPGISELIRSDSPQAKGFETLLNQIDLDGLRKIASELRHGLNCTIIEKYTCGAYNVVFEILFDDGLSWIARLRSASPMALVSAEMVFESPKYKQHITESEIATMRYVKQHTTIPVPEVYGYDTTADNPAKCPYILMEGIHGWRAPPKFGDLSKDALCKILDQLANVLVQLSTLQFPKIGYLHADDSEEYRIDSMLDRQGKPQGPFTTAGDYYRWRADQPLHRSNESLVDLQDALFHSYLYQLSLSFLGKGVLPDGPFPLAHNDLGVHNTLFDEDWNLVGVIDWSGACVVPWESFAQFPGGVTLGPYTRKECNERIYEANQFSQRIFLESLARHEKELGREEVCVYNLLGSPKSEVAQCIEQYDYSFLRRRYRRKLCWLLFGPDMDVELLRKTISQSELYGEMGTGIHKNGKSFDFGDEEEGLHMRGSRRV